MNTGLREQAGLPPGFLETDAPALAAQLGTPTLIHLNGERERPLFVSLLIHGNEITGLQAVQNLLARYRGRALPRALILFVANTGAAAQGLRMLPEQPDWNRVWPGADGAPYIAPCAATRLAAAVLARVAAHRPLAAVDIHNNSGRNPHYACINRLAPAFLQLAGQFSRRILYFVDPPGTLAAAFAPLVPAVTLECGPVGAAAGAVHAADFLDDCLHCAAIDQSWPDPDAVELYRSRARITVPAQVSIGLDDNPDAQLRLPAALEAMNWNPQAAGTVLARIAGLAGLAGTVLQARDDIHHDCTASFLRRRGDRLELARAMVPAMLTVDLRAIRQDCLGYLLEPVALPVEERT